MIPIPTNVILKKRSLNAGGNVIIQSGFTLFSLLDFMLASGNLRSLLNPKEIGEFSKTIVGRLENYGMQLFPDAVI